MESYFSMDEIDKIFRDNKVCNYKKSTLDIKISILFEYLISKGLEVSKKNYGKLFLSSKRFKETYGIDNDELLKKYRKEEGYYEQGTNKRDTNKYRKRIKEC